jgi:CRISPR-associated endonuclease/helicase Cas3
MSATLQPDWLKSVDTRALIESIEPSALRLPDPDKQGSLWLETTKPLTLVEAQDEKALASIVAEKHVDPAGVVSRVTLVIVNTVKRANAVYDALRKNKAVRAEICLVHSRFRPNERSLWRTAFLNRSACTGADRIIVSTQVVEAGVDISADCLITDLAPWPSLVQRFGRAARYGGTAQVFVVDIAEEKRALPYGFPELEAAREALQSLFMEHPGSQRDGHDAATPVPMTDVSQRSIEAFERTIAGTQLIKRLYPYAPAFLLLRKELEDLFDTTPDLTGADLDISRFIRSGEERDCLVFWDSVGKGETPSPSRTPARDELCPVPVGDMRSWVDKLPKDKGYLCWKWDYLDDVWTPATSRDLIPGQTYLVRADAGGYSTERGFDPAVKDPAPVVQQVPAPRKDTVADSGQDNEQLSVTDRWRTIAEHGSDVACILEGIIEQTGGMPAHIASTLDLAARSHDIGKAHPAFASLITVESGHPAGEIAKAPASAWQGGRPRYGVAVGNGFDARPGFRHELASALALLDLLRQANPMHDALLGPWQELMASEIPPSASSAPTPLQSVLDALCKDDVNLLLYLVASHHGKVRTGFQATPSDQEHPVAREGDTMPIRGVMDGDTIPSIAVTMCDSQETQIPTTTLSLQPASIGLSPRTGASWTERCAGLLSKHGPFTLAWLEALLRAADCRASMDRN